MVPAAKTQATQTADNIGDDVVRVELAAVGKEALEEFGADAEEEGTHYESEVEGAPPVRIDNPVEYNGEDEKGQDMQGLVVYVETKLEGREASVTCQQAEDEEGACELKADTHLVVLERAKDEEVKGHRYIISRTFSLVEESKGRRLDEEKLSLIVLV